VQSQMEQQVFGAHPPGFDWRHHYPVISRALLLGRFLQEGDHVQ
jgi:hypothetical protein